MIVRKRDGKEVEFNESKIEKAIEKANEAISEDRLTKEEIKEIVNEVVRKCKEKNVITVEEIQDMVEGELIKRNKYYIAKAYILYRKQREKIRNVDSTLLDYKDVVNGYVKVLDWRVKENSTVTYSVGGLILSNSGAITANYWLSEIYDQEIANAHRNGDIHIHDLSMLSGYCAGWSLKQLIQEGLGGVPGKITSAPAKHLSTLCNQMVNFLGIMQNEWAGAQAFSSFDTYLAPFVKVDNLDYKKVKQCIQSFIYGVNTPSRWGCVDTDTELLTVDGFKKYNQIKKGDKIYTWNNGVLEIQPINEIVIKPHDGILHQYLANGYNQTVTPNHRVLCKKHNVEDYTIKYSDEIFKVKTPYYLPVKFKGSNIVSEKIAKGLSKEDVMFAAIVYCDANIDYRDGNIHKVTIYKSPNRIGNELIVDLANTLSLPYSFTQTKGGFGSSVNKYVFYGDAAKYIVKLIGGAKDNIDLKFMNMDTYLSDVFVKTWAMFDGRSDKFMLQFDNNKIADQLQHIALRAGYTSYIINTLKANYVKIRQSDNISPSSRKEIVYKGDVWCPNVDNGTAIFRKDGKVFISGQCQAPFTNVTLDWTVPNDLAELPCIVGGEEMDFKYKDCKKEMDMVNKAFIETMIEGDANGRGFQYPIPTYSITSDFDWEESENNKLLFEMTAKYGTPYFSNYVNSDMEPSDVRSMCCRLRLDLRELRKKSGGFFGSGESTGSVGVVTINIPRIAYLASDKEDFFKRLTKIMDLSARSLKVKRDVITKLLDNGLYPYTKRYLGTFNNHFSTIGLVGMNEAGLNAKWLQKDMTHEETQEFTKEVLNYMREKLSDYQEMYGDLYNLEATPAESTSYRLAKIDKSMYPEIITANENGDPYYTNSSHLPVWFTDDVFSALDIQDELQTLYTSGTVFHAFLGERLPTWKSAANLVRKIAENYKLPYYTMSPTYSVCAEHGYLTGEENVCPHCGKPTEVYSRITGYYRPVQNWNKGKAQEFKDRKTYAFQGLGAKLDKLNKKVDEEIKEVNNDLSDAKTLLFTTKTCPNCKIVKDMLNNKNVDYQVIDAEENESLCDQFEVMQAPTLVVVHETDKSYDKFANASNIIKYINEKY